MTRLQKSLGVSRTTTKWKPKSKTARSGIVAPNVVTSAHVDNYFGKNKDSKKQSDNKEETKKEKKTPNKPPGLIIDKAALTAAKIGDIAGFLANLPGISDDNDDVKD